MTTGIMLRPSIRLIWHRRDLRLHDNASYVNLSIDDASSANLSLYVFDPDQFTSRPSTCSPSRWDAVRTGPHGARILLESVSDLRTNLRSRGGELLIRTGDPADVVPSIARLLGATEVRWNEEPGTDEADESRRVRDALLGLGGVRVVTDVGYTLYHPDDLPFDAETWRRLAHPKQKAGKKKKRNQRSFSSPQQSDEPNDAFEDDIRPSMHSLVDVSPQRLRGMCPVMGDYRRAVRTYAKVRPTAPQPEQLNQHPGCIEAGEMPTLEELLHPILSRPKTDCRPILGLSTETVESVARAALERRDRASRAGNYTYGSNDSLTRGGEISSLTRLGHFVSGGRAANADRSRADVSNDDSSKLSVHLAMGTLSPRRIYEAAIEAGEGASWLVSHMEMRDYFLYLAFKSGAGLFKRDGVAPVHKKGEKKTEWRDPSSASSGEEAVEQWTRWATGTTGLPLVDASMNELIATGYSSNRVRQNAASVLTKDLMLDWRAGAEWFQFLLEDHCVGANWGNWAYFSGVGNDPKSRHFRTVSQALRYDPDGEYVRRWIPQLRNTEEREAIYRPWDLVEGWQTPIVDPSTQLTWQDMQRFTETHRLFQ